MKVTLHREETNKTHCRGYLTCEEDPDFRIETLEGAQPENDKYIGKCLPLGTYKGIIIYTTLLYNGMHVLGAWPELPDVKWFPRAQFRSSGFARKGHIIIGTEATEFEIKGGEEATHKLSKLLEKAFNKQDFCIDLEIKLSENFVRNDYTLAQYNRMTAIEEERRRRLEAQAIWDGKNNQT